MDQSCNFPYIHGFSEEEQQRLMRQSAFTEHLIYKTIDFSDAKHILEVGSGIGAQTAILLRRFPQLKITCIERNDRQIATAKNYLASLPYTKGRYEIIKADATNLNLSVGSFDGAFICWVLEHIPEPGRVLSELRRVLSKGSRVYLNEVMNSSLFLEPYSPGTWKYWMEFNDFQYDSAGDPFVGAKLGNLLQSQGFRSIQTKVKIEHFDNRHPEKRRQAIQFLRELLLSASNELLDQGRVDKNLVDSMTAELTSVEANPDAVYFYAFMQASAKT